MKAVSSVGQAGLALVVIAHNECRIFIHGLMPGSKPLLVEPPIHSGKKKYENVRDGQSHRGHDEDKFTHEYLESIAHQLHDAKKILVVSHGTGKSNGFGALSEHLKKHHPDLEKRLVGSIEADLSHMSDPQLLAQSRDWLEAHSAFLG